MDIDAGVWDDADDALGAELANMTGTRPPAHVRTSQREPRRAPSPRLPRDVDRPLEGDGWLRHDRGRWQCGIGRDALNTCACNRAPRG